MRPKLNVIKLGETYGENEIKHLDDFKDFYYDINSSKEKILNPKKFVVIGRKGTGKTLFANVVCATYKKENKVSAVESLKEFVFHELRHFNGVDVSPTKYVPIFEWMIYINLSKNIVSNESFFNPSRVDVLNRFLQYFGHVSGDLKIEKTIEMTRKVHGEKNLGVKLFDFGFGLKQTDEETSKEGIRSYLENLENLKNFVMHTLLEADREVIVFYDELDDKFSDTRDFKDGLISFISAIEKVNNLFLKHKIKSKVCAVIRNDIIKKLVSPNINRVFEDNSLTINWEASNPRETELFDMLAHKISMSSPYYKSKDSSLIFKEIMPTHIAHENFKIYILHRTLGRPRDIIRMLNFIQDEYGTNLDRFECYTFTNTSKKYSSYLWREIKSELVGHVDDERLDIYFNFLSSIGKRGFTYELALSKAKNINPIFEDEATLKGMLENLFDAGAIANIYRRGRAEGGDIYYWSYNDEDFRINYSFNFEIHPGLWDVLKIPKPKNRFN